MTGVLVVSAAYGVTLLVLNKALNVATSPKASPPALLFGTFGVAVAIGKVVVDAAKLL